jgi:type I restriction enzyme M protein
MSSQQSGEGDIRKALIEADLVDCMVHLPGQLFYSTPIEACLWFLTRTKRRASHRDRRGQTLFIYARNMGRLLDRTHRELTSEDIVKIASTYHAWRGDNNFTAAYQDISGFCKAVNTKDIAANQYILSPGRYVGAEEIEDDGEPFDPKMKRLAAKLDAQFKESARLEQLIRTNLKGLGYGC